MAQLENLLLPPYVGILNITFTQDILVWHAYVGYLDAVFLTSAIHSMIALPKLRYGFKVSSLPRVKVNASHLLFLTGGASVLL